MMFYYGFNLILAFFFLDIVLSYWYCTFLLRGQDYQSNSSYLIYAHHDLHFDFSNKIVFRKLGAYQRTNKKKLKRDNNTKKTGESG